MVIFSGGVNKLLMVLGALFILSLIVVSIVSVEKGYLHPPVKPQEYKDGEKLVLYVNKVTSVHSPIPYRYHDLPVCVPTGEISLKSQTLGEIITGNRIESSSFEIISMKPENCKKLCDKKLNTDEINKLKDLFQDYYLAQWEIDSLPAAVKMTTQSGEEAYETGFPLGVLDKDGDYVIFNHVRIRITYNRPQPQEAPDMFHVILFEVHPRSIRYPDEGSIPKYCSEEKTVRLSLPKDATKEMDTTYFTYDVEWIPSLTSWEDRWTTYLSLHNAKIHWFSIINSLVIVLFLSGLVAMIMARTIRRDFARYVEDTEVEETGWKLVRTEVFRAPTNKLLFSVLVGSGVQVFSMAVVTLVFAVLGFLSPSNPGSFTTAALVLFVWMGILAGYTSGRIYQMFSGEHKTRQVLLTALLFPGTLFGIAFFLNSFLWYKGSSGAFPFTTMLSLIALWFFISIPLCFLGSRLALRKEPIAFPGTINHIPRQIPDQKWYMHPILTILIGGVLPFGAVFIEAFFIMSSIWLHRYYVIFGFLFLVFLILIVTCAEISIVLCYFQLCSEDWVWWWRSFLTPATSGLYLFLYSVYYYYTRLELDGFVASLLYFGYSLILCLFFSALTGVIGFYSSFWFVRKIYRLIHGD